MYAGQEVAAGQGGVVLARLVSSVLLIAGVVCSSASAQIAPPGSRPYDGIQAGFDAFRLAEERRQASVAQQLWLNDNLKFWAGIPTSRGETIFYGGPAWYGFAAPVVGRDFAYAYGPSLGVFGARRFGFRPLTVFEPWPVVPGDIYGYMFYNPVRQPVGQWQGQTGPNRWESHPVYDPPLGDFRPLPPVASPLLDGTPYATPSVDEGAPPRDKNAEGAPAAPRAAPPPPLPAIPPPAPPRVPREF
jgi:hypothetical protein